MDRAWKRVEVRWLVPLVGAERQALRDADDPTRYAAVEALGARPDVDLLDRGRRPAGGRPADR